MDLLKVSGSEIRKLRESLNWSREKLCEASGVPERTISDIETGISKNPGVETLKKMMEALDPESGTAEIRAELFLRVVGRLATLDKSKLGHVDALLDTLLEPSATSDLLLKKTSL